MNYENLIVDTKGHIRIITLNHPPVNAWNWGMMADFEKAIDDVENDQEVRVLIITGGGEKAFSAGFDLSDSENQHKTGPKGRELWTRIDRDRPFFETGHCCHQWPRPGRRDGTGT
jgi:enoyl-CoA hydratase/carnithine racemase